jgi:hypothetical protein
MSAHNLNYGKAIRMGLEPLERDLFMIQMYADEISEVLESWIAFAGRVVPLIQSDSNATSWKLSPKLLIHRWLTTLRTTSTADFRGRSGSGKQRGALQACTAPKHPPTSTLGLSHRCIAILPQHLHD